MSRNFGSGNYLGPVTGTDELTYTDEKGEFLLVSEKAIVSVCVEVKATGLADKIFSEVKSGEATNELKMELGVIVKGRLLSKGEPVGNVVVGLVQANRTAGEFVGERTVSTDSSGRFAFEHIAPWGKWYLYGAMGSLVNRGALPATPLLVDYDESVHELPDLELCQSYRLTGKVVLADGKPIPPRTKLYVGRRDAWDSCTVELAEDGSFTVFGVPEEEISLTVRVKGYHLSAKNVSRDPYAGGLKGQVLQNIDDLVILLEPGNEPPLQENSKLWQAQEQSKLPLQGASEHE